MNSRHHSSISLGALKGSCTQIEDFQIVYITTDIATTYIRLDVFNSSSLNIDSISYNYMEISLDDVVESLTKRVELVWS